MKIMKQILWGILAYILIALAEGVGMAILHPYGGGEFHAIFAYSGGRLDVALRVYAGYVGIGSGVLFALVFLRYPAHYYAVTAIASFVVFMRWWAVCTFLGNGVGFYSANPKFDRVCLALLPLSMIIIVVVGALAHAASRRVFRPRVAAKVCPDTEEAATGKPGADKTQ